MSKPDVHQADKLYERISNSFEKQNFLNLIDAKLVLLSILLTIFSLP